VYSKQVAGVEVPFNYGLLPAVAPLPKRVVMESHVAYWRKRIGNLSAQAVEVRAPSTKLTAKVAGPVKRKGGIDEAGRPKSGQR
jgi:hypothetical protein